MRTWASVLTHWAGAEDGSSELVLSWFQGCWVRGGLPALVDGPSCTGAEGLGCERGCAVRGAGVAGRGGRDAAAAGGWAGGGAAAGCAGAAGSLFMILTGGIEEA